jgi:biotin transport system substrate-specific component
MKKLFSKDSVILINLLFHIRGLNSYITNILLIFFGTLLLAVSSKIQVPFWPVPMTMQTFVVFIISMAYGWRLSFLTLIAYLIEGAIGMPVFAKGGGLLYLIGPTAGYLYGMTIAAGVMGYFADLGYGKSIIKCIVPLLIGTIIIFVFGVGYLSSIIGFEKALAVGLLPFIPSELFKIVLALFIIPSIWKYIQ